MTFFNRILKTYDETLLKINPKTIFETAELYMLNKCITQANYAATVMAMNRRNFISFITKVRNETTDIYVQTISKNLIIMKKF